VKKKRGTPCCSPRGITDLEGHRVTGGEKHRGKKKRCILLEETNKGEAR